MLAPMNYDEFKRQLGKAGLTLREFAALLNMNSASVSNYSTAVKVPDQLAVIAVLMAEMADVGMDFRPAVAKVGIERKRGRGAGFDSRAESGDDQS